MKKIELSILGLTISQVPGLSLVFLHEKGSTKQLPIIVGTSEAQSIAFALENTHPPRPLSHDVFFNIMVHFGIELKEVYIHSFVEGVFHATMLCERYGQTEQFDIRSSDAIAMAIRFRVPIYTNETVLNSGGGFSINIIQKGKTGKKDMSEMTPEELQQAINDAVKKEDYETASLLKDLLMQRKT